MKSFIVLLFIGMAIAGDDMMGHEKMKKQWADYKAMESCFGEDMMKTSMLKMKKAVVKCTGKDMPELDLPMNASPHRVIHALLTAGQDQEKMQMLKAFQQMSQMGQQSNSQPQGIQLVLGQQAAQPQENMFKKMMMKMMMKKLFSQDESHHDDNKMDFASPFGNIGQQRGNNKYEMMEQMMKTFMNQKHKRSADDELFELGDRLTDKLEQQQKEMQGKLGNASCVLQEIGVIDKNQNIDITTMVKAVKNDEWGTFPDAWLKEHHIKDCNNCATYAKAIPTTVFDECPYGVKWGRIMAFFKCEKEAKYKCCMNHDMKLKLEKSFGKLEDLETATGLAEYQLLPMTMKLLHDQMDMFM